MVFEIGMNPKVDRLLAYTTQRLDLQLYAKDNPTTTTFFEYDRVLID